MTRKVIGFLLFAATSFTFLGVTIARQENMLHAAIAVIMIVLAGIALKDHYIELRGPVPSAAKTTQVLITPNDQISELKGRRRRI
jgi:hypothetical protein